MAVSGKAFRYRNALLSRLGIDPSLPKVTVRRLVQAFLDRIREGQTEVVQDVRESQFRECVRYLQETIGLPNTPSAGSSRAPQTSGLQKILVLSDLHVPFHHEELLASAIRDHQDADVVVLLGDFLDMYSASRFVKVRPLDPIEEIRQAVAIIEVLAEQFPKVIVLEGNHDTRAQRWLQVNRPELSQLLLHPFDYIRYVWDAGRIAKRYPNVEFPEYRVAVSGPDSPVPLRHFTIIGDALLGHFERSLKGPARTVHQLAVEWLPQWGPMLFGDRRIRVLVEAHVHRLAKVQWGPYLLLECGCVADVMRYTLTDPRFSPPQLGYVVLYQRNGVTDFNLSGYVSYPRWSEALSGSQAQECECS